MKAATGELNLTLITVIAVGAILALFMAFLPTIKEMITGKLENADKTDYSASMVEANYEYAFTDYVETELF